MARKLVTITNADFSSVKGLKRTMALIAAIPEEIVTGLQRLEAKTADDIVSRYKAVAPVSALEPHAGALRDSAHREPGLHDLAVKVVVDARDENGAFFAKHVETGHLAPDGSHVAAVPAFYPIIRLARKAFRREAAKVAREGMKKAAARVAGIPE